MSAKFLSVVLVLLQSSSFFAAAGAVPALNATVGQLTTLDMPSGNSGTFETDVKTTLPVFVSAEPGTRSEFAAKVVSGLDGSTLPFNKAGYIIWGTYVNKAARAVDVAQVTSKIGGVSRSQPFDILANKVGPTTVADNAFGLRVMFSAINESSIPALRSFLIGALPLVEAEPGTTNWVALQFPGTKNFGIIDTAPSVDGRNAHLNGQVAAALFANVGVLVESTPVINLTSIFAAGGSQ